MNPKLKLSLEELAVETFIVDGDPTRRRGTIFGHTATMGGNTCEFTCGGGTCGDTCERTCGLSCDWSCRGTCDWSCGGTCDWSCGGTCFTCDMCHISAGGGGPVIYTNADNQIPGGC